MSERPCDGIQLWKVTANIFQILRVGMKWMLEILFPFGIIHGGKFHSLIFCILVVELAVGAYMGGDESRMSVAVGLYGVVVVGATVCVSVIEYADVIDNSLWNQQRIGIGDIHTLGLPRWA